MQRLLRLGRTDGKPHLLVESESVLRRVSRTQQRPFETCAGCREDGATESTIMGGGGLTSVLVPDVACEGNERG